MLPICSNVEIICKYKLCYWNSVKGSASCLNDHPGHSSGKYVNATRLDPVALLHVRFVIWKLISLQNMIVLENVLNSNDMGKHICPAMHSHSLAML